MIFKTLVNTPYHPYYYMQISISNLGEQITNDSLNALFATHGTVDTATITTDANTGRQIASGLVDMPNEHEARMAIDKLDGCIINGQAVVVAASANDSAEQKG